MVQPKYSPQEALERVKLMMKYDTSKTLNENLKVSNLLINEEEKNPNTLTDSDLIGSTNWFRTYIQSVSDFSILGLPNIFDIIGVNLPNLISGRRQGMKGVVDALDGFVDSKDLTYVLTVIKGLDGKCYYDDIEEKTISATERFLQLYQEDEGEDLKTDVNNVGTRTLPTGTDKIKRQIAKTIDAQIAKGCSSTQKNTVNPKISGGTGNSGGGFKLCKGIYSFGCKTNPSGAIGQIQSCLGLVVDGKYGTNTNNKLKEIGYTSFKDEDIQKICNKQPDTSNEPTPEVGGEDMATDATNLDF